MQFREVERGRIKLRVAVAGEGPLLLCVHGWPELWYSWRHQMRYFSERGYTVAAMDVRGYGGSSKPEEISAYAMRELAADVAAVARALSPDPVILFGHDWGAPIVWNTALMHPDAVRAVAGLSVPYRPAGDVMALALWEALYPDRFFYQLYFQQEQEPEAELSADCRRALRKIYYTLSGDAPRDEWLKRKPRNASLLDGLADPDPFPAWMSEEDLETYVEAFQAGGFRGPINRYRAQVLDFEELTEYRNAMVRQPACFIAGEKDPVRHFVPGSDLFADVGSACADFRGATLIPGMGHWIQQEAPEPTNLALERFLAGLDA
jgi:pimeloyl-ACP methyl ester carboxylesterase